MSCRESLIRAVFHLNKSYVALNLCENKDKPELKCGGKCHLKKQIKKNRDEENKATKNNEKEKSELVFITQTENKTKQPTIPNPFLITRCIYTNNYTFSYYANLLRPPKFVYPNTTV